MCKSDRLFSECLPESMGISSTDIINLIDDFERYGFFTHSFLMMRKGHIVAEGYYAPFKKDEFHRAYSISKTFTATAIGLLADEGKLSLYDPVCKFFPEKDTENLHPFIKETKIRDLLMMATPFLGARYDEKTPNWTDVFFTTKPNHPSGTVFRYDSLGTYILCVIVERLTKKPFLEYLKDKVLRDLGFSKNSWCIKAPEGNSWGASGVICSMRDLARLGLLYLNKGRINGKQYLSEEYVKEATKKQIDNNPYGHEKNYNYGYGYKIWITRDNSFSFMGMGDQEVICIPDKDFMFVCHSDNQGNPMSEGMLYELLWRNVVSKMKDSPLEEDKKAYTKLKNKTEKLTLKKPAGEKYSEKVKEINGVSYVLDENPMKITKVSFKFSEDKGTFIYDTPRGQKEIAFGLGDYVLGEFPETHYSGDTIGVPSERGFRYNACGNWVENDKLSVRVNIIDDYFGNLTITMSFKDDTITIYMFKTAEMFLDEYNGFATGKKEK